MLQSYKKRRRSRDLYELVALVWNILTVISGYIQVGRDLTPTYVIRKRAGWYRKMKNSRVVVLKLV